MNIDNVVEGARLIRQGISILDGGPLEYYLERLAGCYRFLLTLAPLQPGARISLTETPEIRHDSGWFGSKHFLVKGAQGTVRAVHATYDGFTYDVEFDDDSWIESHSKIEHKRPPEDRGVFHFSSKWLGPTVTLAQEKS
jgi:hypothetical protein